MELSYVLLGLICINPGISGYQMKSIINDSTGYFFNAHLSQIYPALKRMTAKGWISSSLVKRDGKPDLKLYTITDTGAEALNTWLTEPYEFKLTRANHDAYFTKIMLMGHLPKDDITRYLDAGIAYFTELERTLRENDLNVEREFVANADQPAQTQYLLLWEHEISYIKDDIRSRITWLKRLKEDL